MKPFFSFYGGKWRAAPRYPVPEYNTIVEPFAGAAGYSLRHYERDVILIEKDPRIAELWKYLIRAASDEILALPLFTQDMRTVDDMSVSDAAKSLIGFWLNKGTASPCKSPSAWMRQGLRPKSFWGPEIRSRIASQVQYIKHWQVCNGDYTEAPNIEATWFVDPPYKSAGKLYRFSSRLVNYEALADWCMCRSGQVMVCENEGEKWLPFQPFITIKSTEGSRGKAQSREALWVNK